jgi:hypothetical protein
MPGLRHCTYTGDAFRPSLPTGCNRRRGTPTALVAGRVYTAEWLTVNVIPAGIADTGRLLLVLVQGETVRVQVRGKLLAKGCKGFQRVSRGSNQRRCSELHERTAKEVERH